MLYWIQKWAYFNNVAINRTIFAKDNVVEVK